MGWISKIILAALIALIAFAVGAVYALVNESDRHWSKLVVGDVVNVRCSDNGCSLLVRRTDSSTDWVWVPSVETKKEKK